MRRFALALLFLPLALPLHADEPKPPELTPEEQKLAAEATKLNREGVQLYQRGQGVAALAKFREVLEVRQKLYPAAKYPGGHPDLATSLNNMGFVLNAMGQAEKAVPFYQQSLDMNRTLYPAAKYPGGHPHLAQSLNNMGAVLQAMGQAEKAAPFLQQSLDIRRTLYPAAKYPAGHPDLAASLNNMGAVLEAMGQAEKAVPFYQQSLDMNRTLYPAAKYPGGHPHLAQSLNNMGAVLQAMGQAEKAAPFLQQSLDIRRTLYPAAKYPGGHPDLAQSLNNMGYVLQAMGQAEKAAPFYQQSLDMNRTLYPAAKYPGGHPDLARSLNNMGAVLRAMGQAEQAAPFYQQGLDMRRTLYPAAKYPGGHPDLALSLNNMGFVLQAMGQAEQAVPFYQQGLDMRRTLYPAAKYPGGHPDLANSLNSMGAVLQAMGQAEQAGTLYQQSLEMQQRFLQRELLTASESAAFDRVAKEPLTRDAYLSATRTLNVAARDSYRLVAPSRSMVTRLLEQRLANARAAGTELGDKLDRLRGLRRRLDQLLQNSTMKPEDRDKLLTAVANERDALEREVVAAMPTLQRWAELDKLGPMDLAKGLPSGAVYIDVIRYTNFEYVEKKQKRTPQYVAFVVAGGEGGRITRVELGDAAAIDALVSAWREQIATGADGSRTDGELARLVWGKIASAIPAGTTTLYLALDGDLARMPWAALPIAKDRVLLEQYAIAEVPHGTWLLDQLRTQRNAAANPSLLAIGGVDFSGSNWPALPGTVTELSAIAALRAERETVTGKDATRANLVARLPRAGYLHLATHGQFDAEAFSKERQRAAKALESQQFGENSRSIGAKNPLGYVGVVLAGGEVFSGLNIVDLKMNHLKLVTLSACETGLGALTGGEGVQGLQRAFHLAGCPNVVASLWQVSDAATAALMAKFYHELWLNKKPPIEALREAQLTIYRHPELIPDLAGDRGAPKLKQALATPVSAAPRAAGRAKTHQWAAFVLSGVGK